MYSIYDCHIIYLGPYYICGHIQYIYVYHTTHTQFMNAYTVSNTHHTNTTCSSHTCTYMIHVPHTSSHTYMTYVKSCTDGISHNKRSCHFCRIPFDANNLKQYVSDHIATFRLLSSKNN